MDQIKNWSKITDVNSLLNLNFGLSTFLTKKIKIKVCHL